MAYLCHGDFVRTHVSGIDARLPLFRRDDYFLQLIMSIEGNVQRGVCLFSVVSAVRRKRSVRVA